MILSKRGPPPRGDTPCYRRIVLKVFGEGTSRGHSDVLEGGARLEGPPVLPPNCVDKLIKKDNTRSSVRGERVRPLT